MSASSLVGLGLDFGTESVRALLVDLEGNEHGSAVVDYAHGQITERLPATGEVLPPDFALQHPLDWIDAAAAAVRSALASGKVEPSRILGIGVDFTSCTMLPALADGTPLCVDPRWASEKFAWPKLWKHHGAKSQTDRINAVARERKEGWLDRYGGTIGLEWFFPKILETLEHSPQVYDATAIWLEAGDWFVWQLVGGDAARLPRSTCQAGYKALWHSRDGFPSADYFRAVHPRLANVVAEKMPGRFLAPGEQAGRLTPVMADRFGLPAGFQGIAMNIAGVLVLRFIGSLQHSAAAQAAYAVGYSELFSLITWTSVGLMGASATIAPRAKPVETSAAVAACTSTACRDFASVGLSG